MILIIFIHSSYMYTVLEQEITVHRLRQLQEAVRNRRCSRLNFTLKEVLLGKSAKARIYRFCGKGLSALSIDGKTVE